MSRETCQHFVPDSYQCEQCETERVWAIEKPANRYLRLITEARWIVRNAEPAPDIYVDPARRGEWRQQREKWLTDADALLG